MYDTEKGAKVELITPDQHTFSMYVCGPTVYGSPHLGHGRMACVFDLLRRHLVHRGLEVTFVSNITDVDDKIVARAATEKKPPGEIAKTYEQEWWEAMALLGVAAPTHAPRATEWLDEMFTTIAELRAKGFAYDTSEGVYLDVSQVPDYGSLSHQDVSALRAGARVVVDDFKRSPADFALWKFVGMTEFGYESPFGFGRPGWHTECVAMSHGLLGDTFDLHGGGLDLIFPHHENELAQARLLGRGFARHWVHNGFVEMEGEKMSKSLGNTRGLAEIIALFGGPVVRFAYLRSSYRAPCELGDDSLGDSRRAISRIRECLSRLDGTPDPAGIGPDEEALGRFGAALDDDLDTPLALSVLFDAVRAANSAIDCQDWPSAHSLGEAVREMCDWLGIALADHESISEDVAARVAERERAKERRDYALADRIRQEVRLEGFEIRDTPEGPRVGPISE